MTHGPESWLRGPRDDFSGVEGPGVGVGHALLRSPVAALERAQGRDRHACISAALSPRRSICAVRLRTRGGPRRRDTRPRPQAGQNGDSTTKEQQDAAVGNAKTKGGVEEDDEEAGNIAIAALCLILASVATGVLVYSHTSQLNLATDRGGYEEISSTSGLSASTISVITDEGADDEGTEI